MAKGIISQIATCNNIKMDTDYEFVDQIDTYNRSSSVDSKPLENQVATPGQIKKDMGYSDLFKYKSLSVVTIGGSIMYMVTQYIYYGIIFSIGDLGGNLYLNCFFLGFSEFLGYCVSIPIVRKLKRKFAFSATFFLAGVASLAFLFVTLPGDCQGDDQTCWQKTFQIVLAMITRFMISIVFLIIYLYLNELYPTPVRALGTGLCTFNGRIGSIVASPLLYVLKGVNQSLPWVSFGIVAIIAGFVTLCMRETFGLPLENEIMEEREKKLQVSEERLTKSKIFESSS